MLNPSFQQAAVYWLNRQTESQGNRNAASLKGDFTHFELQTFELSMDLV